MERPAKRQKLSKDARLPATTRTLDLPGRRLPAKVILPRVPDVTVTAAVVDVAVNDESPTIQIPAPTADIAVTLDSLGTLTVLGVETATAPSSDRDSVAASTPSAVSPLQPSSLESSSLAASTPSTSATSALPGLPESSESSESSQSSELSQSFRSSQSSESSQPSQSFGSSEPPTAVSSSSSLLSSLGVNSAQSVTIIPSNSTLISTTQPTVTVTETSTYRVSYYNGTFIAPTSTRQPTNTASTSGDEDISQSSSNRLSSTSSKYVFGDGVTVTYTSKFSSSTASGSSNAGVGAIATGAGSGVTGVGGTDGGSGSGDGNGTGNDSGDSSPSGPMLTPQQTQMVGGIVGGLAGVALVLVVVLFLLRRYRMRLKGQGRLPEQLTSGHSRGGSGLIGAAEPMSHSRSSLFFPPAVVVSSMKKWRPGSDMTMMTNTTSTTGADSEKGFQRVSGRKIPSVLSTGGDQYGGSYGAFEKEIRPLGAGHHHDLSESSFYRDADGTYVGSGNGFGRSASRSAPSTPVHPTIFSGESGRRPSLANITATDRRDFANSDINRAFYRNLNMNAAAPNATSDGMAVFRSSPARTPVTQSPVSSSLRLPIQAPVTMDEDIPEMPLPSPGLGLGVRHDLAQQRMPSRLSTKTTGSATGSGRFREEMS